MKKKDILAIIAIVFFLVSPSLAFYIVPSMKRLPDDLNQVVTYEGRLGMLNQETYTFDYSPIGITRNINALREEDGILIIREDIEGVNKQTGDPIELLAQTFIWGVDPFTSENVAGYGDLDRNGQWIFPVGVEKKDYLVWNQDLDGAVLDGYITADEAVAVGRYLGEEKRGGINTYKFQGSQENVFIGYFPDLPEAEMFYYGRLTVWTDPTTGAIVDLRKDVSQYIDFPDLHKLPSNLNTSVYLSGTATILNTSNGQLEDFEVTLCNQLAVESIHDEYYMIKNVVTAEDEKGNRIEDLCSSSIDPVDPFTMEYDIFLSDKEGLLTFTVGVEKKDYLLYDSNIDAAPRTRYVGDIEIAGLPMYVYYVETTDYPIGTQELPGVSDRWAELFYTGNTTYYVEPSTGSIAYVEKYGTVSAQFPDLHTIPENTEAELFMEGELSILTQNYDIEMQRNLKVENVYWEDGNKVLVIQDDTSIFDKATGEIIDMASGSETHGVYADTAYMAQNYGDMEREGLYTFPAGVEKQSYEMWNTEIDMPSIVTFVREEDHNGVHTYLFETQEDRMVTDASLGFSMPVRYVTSTYYWVEPNTGLIIDVTKESYKKANILSVLTGFRGLFWIDVMKLTLSYPEETQEAMAESAKKNMGVIQLSNSKVNALDIHLSSEDLIAGISEAAATKTQIESLSGNRVKAADLTYQMTEQAVDDMAATAKETTFLLMFMQIIVPAFLILMGIILIAIWTRR